MTFIGLLGSFPFHGNNFRLAISLTPEKREKWPILIRSYLKLGGSPIGFLGRLIGRLSFSKTEIFGKFPRAQQRPLYTKLYRRVYNSRLPKLERDTLRWWGDVIAEFDPRLSAPRPARADWLIYTDAATDPLLFALSFSTATPPLLIWTPVMHSAFQWSGNTFFGTLL